MPKDKDNPSPDCNWFYGPCSADAPFPEKFTPEMNFIPAAYHGQLDKNCSIDQLRKRGFTFTIEDFPNGAEGAKLFLHKGVVSSDRTMAVIFCDLKGSTPALRVLKGAFRTVQNEFFKNCSQAVEAANKMNFNHVQSNPDPAANYPRAVVDKFMGDCAMFYVDAGNTEVAEARKSLTAHMVAKIVIEVVEGIEAIQAKYRFQLKSIKLGARFGIAFGDQIMLSTLGCGVSEDRTQDDSKTIFMDIVAGFSVTGEVVNLAARLEHATAAEFLSCIDQSRRHLEAFSKSIGDKDRLRTTALGDAIAECDQEIINLYSVCEKTFEIRVDDEFRKWLEHGNDPIILPWRVIPFAPRGFDDWRKANIVGGASAADLFRKL